MDFSYNRIEILNVANPMANLKDQYFIRSKNDFASSLLNAESNHNIFFCDGMEILVESQTTVELFFMSKKEQEKCRKGPGPTNNRKKCVSEKVMPKN